MRTQRASHEVAIAPSLGGPACLCLLSLLILHAAPSAAAGLIIPDSTSLLYRSFVAVAGDNLQAEQDCLFSGNLHSNEDIDLDKKSSVTGNISATGSVANHGTVTGTVTAHAPAKVLPAFPTEVQARALATRVFTKDTIFKNAVVDDIVFVAGDVTVRGSLNGGGTIIARGELRLEAVDKDAPGPLASSTKLSLLSFENIRIGKSRQLRGLIYAQGNADLAAAIAFEGVLIARHKLHVGRGAQLAFLDLDTTPPVISQPVPAIGSLLASASPTISAAFSDDLSGVDAASTRFLLDGTDQTSRAQVAATGFNFIPPSALTDGGHTAALSVRDFAKNLAQAAWTFTTDITPPTLVITSPSSATVGTASPALAVSYSDATSGIDLTSLHIILDGTDLTSNCQVGGAAAACTPAPLKAGPHTLTAGIRDRAGNQATASLSFQVVVDTTPPSVAILAPSDGSYLASAVPTIGGSYAAASGIDPASVALELDGTNVTAAAQVGASGLQFRPATPLAEGAHLVQLTAISRAGTAGFASSKFFVDLTPPAIAVTSPTGVLVSPNPRPAVTVTYSDEGSGIAAASLEVALDGSTNPLSCTAGTAAAVCALAGDLAPGPHTLSASVRDAAGNRGTTQAAFTLTLDLPPTVIILAPAAGSHVRTSPVQVTGTAASAAGVMAVRVNGGLATLTGSQFSAAVTLHSGANSIMVSAVDAAGQTGSARVVVTLDSALPALTLKTPAPGAIVNAATVSVAGQVADAGPGVAVTVDGRPAPVENGGFAAEVSLVEGLNTITVAAIDQAGSVAQVSVQVTRFSLPTVAIASPSDLSYLATTTVDVLGTVSDPAATVTVNGRAAVLTGSSFVAAGVPLIEGGNTLTATATSALGHVGTASVNVVRDLTPPRLSIDYPRDGSAVLDSAITVSGLVNDVVPGTVNAAQVSVTVNGMPATVANRSFVVDGVPLAPGANTLTAVAVDVSGNMGRVSVTVRSVSQAGVARVTAFSGNRQHAVIGTALPQPLVAQLVDAAGAPVAGKPVAFQLRGNDGSLGTAGRVAVVTTDSAGRAGVTFALGTRAGAATQVVAATAAGFAGPAIFTEEALPGQPALLVVDSGDEQVGVAGQQLARPLIAAVTDSGFNRLGGVAVDFTVVKGHGHFLNGLITLTAVSDGDGRVIAPLVLDPAEGIANNAVSARISGLATSPVAAFVATGRAAGPASATSVSGVVLDNTNTPISGVTLRILDTPLVAQTDAQGQFRLNATPVGAVTLIVDGSTANRSGSWPDLEYSLVTIAGRDTTPNMPIYLLPLDLQHGLMVDETHGGTLTLPEVPGFALQIAPGSVIFPGGGRSGVVSVTVVHNDKVPMVPNFGQQPRFIVTIQPAGARFDPPAQMTLPNLEGLHPGAVTEMYSFDHDLGHFVSIGPATVSDDGSMIVSNPGVGVVKAGWHCGGNPALFGTPNECPQCSRCDGVSCVPTSAAACDDGDPCTVGDVCIKGVCTGAPLQPGTVTATADGKTGEDIVAIGSSVSFSAVAALPNCPSPPAYRWDFGDGSTSTDPAPMHTYATNDVYDVHLQVTCPPCPTALAEDSLLVFVVALKQLTITRGATQTHMVGSQVWGTLMNSGAVVLKATLEPDPDGAANLLTWSGITSLDLDRTTAYLATNQIARQIVVARVGTSADAVHVWIMWATIALNKCGASQCGGDNLRVISGHGTFPDLGPQTSYLQPGRINFALGVGEAEVAAVLLPQGVSSVLDGNDSGWHFRQLATYVACRNGVTAGLGIDTDDTADTQQTAPDAQEQIYFIDGPSVGAPPVNHTIEVYDSFKVWATWNDKIGSDYFFWNYQGAANVDLPAASQVEVNALGPGVLTLPSICRYKPVT
jgi:hypothetical protein